MDVCKPSTSLALADAPALRPVIRQFTDGPAQLSGCSAIPFELVGWGLPRSHRPEVAVFAPAVSVQPRAASKSSLNSTVGAAGWNRAVKVVSFCGVAISCDAC